ncbi:hypothetical protein ACJJTC_002110, partial [Scirpophaga incertulas]
HWELIVGGDFRRGRSGQPAASLTQLGWVIHGPVSCREEGHERVNQLSDLEDIVKKQFELDAIGISKESRQNSDHARAEKILQETSKRTADEWEVGLLWKQDDIDLPDNYKEAEKRLKNIERKMDQDEQYANAYCQQMQRLIDKGYAQKVNGGNFHIRDWKTNSCELRKQLPDSISSSVDLTRLMGKVERTLGMIWNTEEDTITFDLSFKKIKKEIAEGQEIPTKREFLRFIMSLFDPLGLICPLTIDSRILMQRVWRTGIQWDEPLTEDCFVDWKKWLCDLEARGLYMDDGPTFPTSTTRRVARDDQLRRYRRKHARDTYHRASTCNDGATRTAD